MNNRRAVRDPQRRLILTVDEIPLSHEAMSVPGDLTELISTARSRWDTVRCRGHEWRHHARLNEAFLGGVNQGPAVYVMAVSEGPHAQEGREAWHLWVASSNRIRTEFAVGYETVTAVIDGSTWWSWSPSRGALTNGGDEHSQHGLGPGYPLTDPASVSAALDLEVLGRTRVAGRSAFRVLAHPTARQDLDFDDRGAADTALHDLGTGADEYELAVDEKRGIILRSEGRLGGLPFRVIEMDEVVFDEDLGSECFTLVPPTGQDFEVVTPPHLRP